MHYKFDSLFPRYKKYNPKVPVWCVTPKITGTIHRFFDTSPISPSGRYLALTKFPYENKLPLPGDEAEVILIDLKTGKKESLYQTSGWDTQLGAQVQWGKDDTELFFNDVDTNKWNPFGIKMNPITGEQQKLEGTIYMVSPDGKYSISPCLLRTGLTQPGYGVIVPEERVPENTGIPEDDGIYITNNDTGKKELLVSIKKIIDKTCLFKKNKDFTNDTFYGFHVKWNKIGNKIMFVLRYKKTNGDIVPNLITINFDGEVQEIYVSIPGEEWGKKGGHHPNWCPDGKRVMMNLKINKNKMRLVKANYDGSNYKTMSDKIVGSGHPSLHPNEKHIITDSYLHEVFAYDDGTTPLRLINLENESEKEIVRIRTKPLYDGPNNELRVDPHPAWDNNYTYVVFNACPQGKRKVFITDLTHYL